MLDLNKNLLVSNKHTVSASQVDSASWIYAAASLFTEAACFLGVSSRCMWDASHSLRPLPRAQWFCEGSLPSSLAVGVALCLGCAFVLVCVHARLVQGCVCHEASVLTSFDSVDGLFSAILGPFQVSKPAGRSHQPTAIDSLSYVGQSRSFGVDKPPQTTRKRVFSGRTSIREGLQ